MHVRIIQLAQLSQRPRDDLCRRIFR